MKKVPNQRIEYVNDNVNDYEPFDPDKPVYGTYTLPCCLTLNGTINGIHTDDIVTKDDIDDLGASHFKLIDGYPSVDISYSNLTFYSPEDVDDDPMTSLTIRINDSLKEVLKVKTELLQVFEFRVFKDLNLYDQDGLLVKKLYISYENSEWICPVVNLLTHETHDLGAIHKASIEYQRVALNDNPFMKIHKDISDIKLLFTNGSFILSYVLSPDYLRSDTGRVSCDTIEAKNALTLVETSNIYLYEPTKIDDYNYDGVDYWRQTYSIPSEQVIVDGQQFEFMDFLTGLTYSLVWNESRNKWVGYNAVNAVKAVMDRYSIGLKNYLVFCIARTEPNLTFLSYYGFNTSTNIIKQIFDKGSVKYFVENLNGERFQINVDYRHGKESSFVQDNITYDKSGEISIARKEVTKYIPIDIDNPPVLPFILELTIGGSTTTFTWKITDDVGLELLIGDGVENLAHKLNLKVLEEINSTTGNPKDIELFNRKNMESMDPDYPAGRTVRESFSSHQRSQVLQS